MFGVNLYLVMKENLLVQNQLSNGRKCLRKWAVGGQYLLRSDKPSEREATVEHVLQSARRSLKSNYEASRQLQISPYKFGKNPS
ncbi:hypothetical protein TNCV_4249231 [Trichonephila clavipes]|nr:hypothetical protein TNCV_4249231 [Trichonephila clavipes]